MPYRKILADNVLTFREIENISQEELAYRCGVSKETISLIEREKSNISLNILEKLASYTGLTISELFTKNLVNKKFSSDK